MSRVPELVYNLWVRMWRERDADAGIWEWRGLVKDSRSQIERPFRKMEGLIDAITDLTPEPPLDGGDEPKGSGG